MSKSTNYFIKGLVFFMYSQFDPKIFISLGTHYTYTVWIKLFILDSLNVFVMDNLFTQYSLLEIK